MKKSWVLEVSTIQSAMSVTSKQVIALQWVCVYLNHNWNMGSITGWYHNCSSSTVTAVSSQVPPHHSEQQGHSNEEVASDSSHCDVRKGSWFSKYKLTAKNPSLWSHQQSGTAGVLKIMWGSLLVHCVVLLDLFHPYWHGSLPHHITMDLAVMLTQLYPPTNVESSVRPNWNSSRMTPAHVMIASMWILPC